MITAAVFSKGMARIPNLANLLGVERVVLRPAARRAGEVNVVAGWGLKPSAQVAQAYATKHRLPFVRVEDGFLRSVGLAANGARPLSIVTDSVGIYYDATRPSQLEHLLNGVEGVDAGGKEGAAEAETRDPLESAELLARARAAMDNIAEARLSKYNHAPEVELPPSDRPRVLVVDQTWRDLSVRYGLADESIFGAMLKAAEQENPGAEIIVKTHPDVVAGKKVDIYYFVTPEWEFDEYRELTKPSNIKDESPDESPDELPSVEL